MDGKILSYADEILSMDEPMSRKKVRKYLAKTYNLTVYEMDSVCSVLEGEGYFDGE